MRTHTASGQHPLFPRRPCYRGHGDCFVHAECAVTVRIGPSFFFPAGSMRRKGLAPLFNLMYSRRPSIRPNLVSHKVRLRIWDEGCPAALKQTCPRPKPRAQFAFKHSMIHGILQFTLRIAFRCVLHRCESQDIRC